MPDFAKLIREQETEKTTDIAGRPASRDRTGLFEREIEHYNNSLPASEDEIISIGARHGFGSSREEIAGKVSGEMEGIPTVESFVKSRGGYGDDELKKGSEEYLRDITSVRNRLRQDRFVIGLDDKTESTLRTQERLRIWKNSGFDPAQVEKWIEENIPETASGPMAISRSEAKAYLGIGEGGEQGDYLRGVKKFLGPNVTKRDIKAFDVIHQMAGRMAQIQQAYAERGMDPEGAQLRISDFGDMTDREFFALNKYLIHRKLKREGITEIGDIVPPGADKDMHEFYRSALTMSDADLRLADRAIRAMGEKKQGHLAAEEAKFLQATGASPFGGDPSKAWQTFNVGVQRVGAAATFGVSDLAIQGARAAGMEAPSLDDWREAYDQQPMLAKLGIGVAEFVALVKGGGGKIAGDVGNASFKKMKQIAINKALKDGKSMREAVELFRKSEHLVREQAQSIGMTTMMMAYGGGSEFIRSGDSVSALQQAGISGILGSVGTFGGDYLARAMSPNMNPFMRRMIAEQATEAVTNIGMAGAYGGVQTEDIIVGMAMSLFMSRRLARQDAIDGWQAARRAAGENPRKILRDRDRLIRETKELQDVIKGGDAEAIAKQAEKMVGESIEDTEMMKELLTQGDATKAKALERAIEGVDIANVTDLTVRLKRTGFGSDAEIAGVEALVRATAASEGIDADSLVRETITDVVKGGAPDTEALMQRAKRFRPLPADAPPEMRREMIEQPPPKEIVDAGFGDTTDIEWVKIGSDDDVPEIGLPGGLKGLDDDSTFTFWDMQRLRAQGIDPSRIDPKTYKKIHDKMSRTHRRNMQEDGFDALNRAAFAVTSSGTNLYANEVIASLVRMRDPKQIASVAKLWKQAERDVKAGRAIKDDGTPAEVQGRAGWLLMNRVGMNKDGAVGGDKLSFTRSTRVNNNMGGVVYMAKLANEKGVDWFRMGKDETPAQYVERLTNEVKGLGLKTANFGNMMADLIDWPFPTVDSHIMQLLGYEKASPRGAQKDLRTVIEGSQYEAVSNELMNLRDLNEEGIQAIRDRLDEKAAAAGTDKVRDNVLKFKGDLEKIVEMVREVGPEMKKMSPGQFQWWAWDIVRGKLEPHVMVFPGIDKIKGKTRAQLAEAVTGPGGLRDMGFTSDAKLKFPVTEPKRIALWQDAKASVEFAEDGKAVIRALANPDVSSAVHELAHVFRRRLEMRDDTLYHDATKAILGDPRAEWTREAEEHFARGFEKYLRDGKAPTMELKTVFDRFSKWLRTIYTSIRDSEIDVEISPQLREVFDNMLAPAGRRPELGDARVAIAMLRKSYGQGRMKPQYEDAEALASDTDNVRWFRDDDGKRIGVMLYKDTPFGTKVTAVGNLNDEGRAMSADALAKAHADGGFSEASGPLLRWAQRKGIPQVDQDTAMAVMRAMGKDVEPGEGNSYIRTLVIDGEERRVAKTMIGTPDLAPLRETEVTAKAVLDEPAQKPKNELEFSDDEVAAIAAAARGDGGEASTGKLYSGIDPMELARQTNKVGALIRAVDDKLWAPVVGKLGSKMRDITNSVAEILPQGLKDWAHATWEKGPHIASREARSLMAERQRNDNLARHVAKKQLRALSVNDGKPLTPEQKEMGVLYLEGETTRDAIVQEMGEEYAAKLDYARERLDDADRRLAEVGWLSEEVMQDWQGRWLPRLYTRKEAERGRATDVPARTGAQKMPPVYMRRDKWIVAWRESGKVRNQKFESRQEAVDFATGLRNDRDIQGRRDARSRLRGDVRNWQNRQLQQTNEAPPVGKIGSVDVVAPLTKEQREYLGEVRDPAILVARGRIAQETILGVNRLLQQMARSPKLSSDVPRAGFNKNQVPNDPSKYGELAGLYLHKSVYNDVMGMVRQPSGFLDTVAGVADTLLAQWKWGKTAGNPGTHGRNVLSNVYFSHMAGMNILSPANAPYVVKAFGTLVKKNRTLEFLIKEGLYGSDYISAELGDLAREVSKMGGATYQEKIKNYLASKAGEFKKGRFFTSIPGTELLSLAYRLEDEIPKIATWHKLVDEGMDPREAAARVRRDFPQYDEAITQAYLRSRSPGAALMRQVTPPFLTFAAEATRIMSRNMVMRPFQSAIFFGALYAAKEQLLEMAGISDEDLERAQISAPPWRRPGLTNWVLPWRDEQGRLLTYDLTYTLPMGEYVERFLRTLRGDDRPEERMDTALSWAGPFLSLAVQVGMNRDAFRDRPINRSKGEGEFVAVSEAQGRRDTWKFVGEQLFPSIFPGVGYNWNKIMEAVNEVPIDLEGTETRSKLLTFLDTLVGIKIRPFDIDRDAAYRLRRIESVMQKKLSRLDSLARQPEGYRGISDADRRREYDEIVADVTELWNASLQLRGMESLPGGELPDHLKEQIEERTVEGGRPRRPRLPGKLLGMSPEERVEMGVNTGAITEDEAPEKLRNLQSRLGE